MNGQMTWGGVTDEAGDVEPDANNGVEWQPQKYGPSSTRDQAELEQNQREFFLFFLWVHGLSPSLAETLIWAPVGPTAPAFFWG